MTDGDVRDWLSVAVGTLLDYPAGILDQAALEARRTCTHHSQIVPTIVREADLLLARYASLREASAPSNIAILPTPKRLPPPRLTQADVDAMSEKLIRIGITCGALVRDADGNVGPAPEAAE